MVENIFLYQSDYKVITKKLPFFLFEKKMFEKDLSTF